MFSDLQFKYPNNIFYMLIAVVALFFIILAYIKKEKIMAALRIKIKIRFKVLRIALTVLSLLLIAFSLMGPQVLEGSMEVEKASMDIFILIDTSKSMQATDLKPDRISVAKNIIGNLIDNLTTDRIGIIPFAADAYIQMPLTDDYPLAKMYLNSIDTNMIIGGGSNIAAAIRLANNSFSRTESSDMVMIILSDGEEHDSGSVAALSEITDNKIRIYTIGIGTEAGGFIPIYNTDGEVTDYMTDSNGNTVNSRLIPSTLKLIAERTNGVYYQAGVQGMEVSALIKELSVLERAAQAVDVIEWYTQYYQYFLAAGIFLFLISWFLPERRVVA